MRIDDLLHFDTQHIFIYVINDETFYDARTGKFLVIFSVSFIPKINLNGMIFWNPMTHKVHFRYANYLEMNSIFQAYEIIINYAKSNTLYIVYA